MGNADVIATTNYKTVDATKPVITVDALPAKTKVASQTVTGTATDNQTLDSGIREVKITLNGVQVYLNNTQDNVSFSSRDADRGRQHDRGDRQGLQRQHGDEDRSRAA